MFSGLGTRPFFRFQDPPKVRCLVFSVHHFRGIVNEVYFSFCWHVHLVEVSFATFEVMFYSSFGHLINTHVVIKLGNGRYLFFRIALFLANPSLQFGTLRGVGLIEGVNQHVGFLVAYDIAPDGLSKHLAVAVHV